MKKNKFYYFLLPVLALILCIWLASEQYAWFDKKIEIIFTDATLIQPEKTKIVYKGITIGMIKDVQLSEDGKNAIAKAVLYKKADRFAVEGSNFYIVSPQISFSGVKGLETIIQGSYIVVRPGPEDAPPANQFKGSLNETGQASTSEQFYEYILETTDAEAVSAGDAISFRGVNIGNVGNVEISKDSSKVLVKIHIQNKFAKLVRSNTVFWKKDAIKADIGLFGADIEVNSLETMMKGGISLGTPAPVGPLAKYGTTFELHEKAPKGF